MFPPMIVFLLLYLLLHWRSTGLSFILLLLRLYTGTSCARAHDLGPVFRPPQPPAIARVLPAHHCFDLADKKKTDPVSVSTGTG